MNPTALITGATSGIGEAAAKLLSQNNFRLILTGRRMHRLKEVKAKITNESDTDVLLLSFDVRDRKEAENAIDSLPDKWKNIDVLINNAGLAAGLAPIQEGDVDDWDQMIDTNVKGLLYVSRPVSRLMIERGKGHIVNISSIAGRETYPEGNVYCATKYAVESITRGMRIDMLPHGIKVSSVSPGAVETEFSLVRFKGDEKKAESVYEGFTPLNAEDVAETILFVITRPPHVNIDDVLIMPTAQAFTRGFHRKSQ